MKVNSIQTTNSYYNQNKSMVSQKGNTTDSNETIVKSGPVPSADVTQFKKAIKTDVVENPIKAIINKLFGKNKTTANSNAANNGNDYFDWDAMVAGELARIY